MRRLLTLVCVIFLAITSLAARTITKHDELALRLHTIAQRCVQRAKKMSPGIAGADDLFLTARICAKAAEDLFSSNTQDKEAVMRHVAALLNGTRHGDMLIRRGLPTNIKREEDACVHMPLDEIITLIEEEKLDLYLRPTPLQLTAKRMVFKLIVELFHSFGRRALEAQKPSTAPPTAAASGALPRKVWSKFGTELRTHFINKRPQFYLRTLRILANKFIDKTTPHPEQPQWHKPLEMFIPLLLGQIISYLVNYKDKNKYDMAYEIGGDALIRAAYSRFYAEEGTREYKYINILCWLLPFILEDTSKRLWREANKDGSDAARPITERFKVYGASAKENFPDILTEGLVTIAIWNTIDDWLMPKIEIPQWLLATPVQRTKQELLSSEDLEDLLEESPE